MNLGREISGFKHVLRDFPGSLVVKTLPYDAGVLVPSLVGKLRSHVLHSVTKN